jgi:hypothetical protein
MTLISTRRDRPRLNSILTGLMSVGLVVTLPGCTRDIVEQYEATALTQYVWQVDYTLINAEDRRPPRKERFATTTLLNRNGEPPDEASITGPDDQGLWWPPLPPRPTVDEMEARQKNGEQIGRPELIKNVEYSFGYELGGQVKTYSTSYSVYRQVVKSLPAQQPLEVVFSPDERAVLQVNPHQ